MQNQISKKTQLELDKARREQQDQTELIFNGFRELDRQNRKDVEIVVSVRPSTGGTQETKRTLKIVSK
jgi:hypothetical protein